MSFQFAALSSGPHCVEACVHNHGTGTEAWAHKARELASAQSAFKVLVLRLVLRCVRVIACRRVLHRLGSQDIHCYELFDYLRERRGRPQTRHLLRVCFRPRARQAGCRKLS